MKFLHLFRDPASEPHELHLHGDEGKGEGPVSVVETDHRFANQLQRQAQTGKAQQGDLLYPTRSPGADRAMAAGIQYAPASQLVELPPPGTRSLAALRAHLLAEL